MCGYSTGDCMVVGSYLCQVPFLSQPSKLPALDVILHLGAEISQWSSKLEN